MKSRSSKKIEHIQNTIIPVLIISDRKVPQEKPHSLIAQLRKTILDIELLVIRTNNITKIENESTLMESLAKKDSINVLSEKLRNIKFAAQINNSGEKELKTTIGIKKLQAEMD